MMWSQYVMPIQTINKLTFCMSAISSCADGEGTPEGKLGMISVIASEILREVAPEIEAIKQNEMAKANKT